MRCVAGHGMCCMTQCGCPCKMRHVGRAAVHVQYVKYMDMKAFITWHYIAYKASANQYRLVIYGYNHIVFSYYLAKSTSSAVHNNRHNSDGERCMTDEKWHITGVTTVHTHSQLPTNQQPETVCRGHHQQMLSTQFLNPIP